MLVKNRTAVKWQPVPPSDCYNRQILRESNPFGRAFPIPPRILTAKSDCPDKLQAMLPGTERNGYGFIFRR